MPVEKCEHCGATEGLIQFPGSKPSDPDPLNPGHRLGDKARDHIQVDNAYCTMCHRDTVPRRAKCPATAQESEGQAAYSEYLSTPEWQRIRFAVLWRDKTCRLCGSTDRLEPHHNHYRKWGSEQPEDLIALCHACHSRHHGKAE